MTEERTWIKDFARCICESLNESGNEITINDFFRGFMQSDEFKFFNNKEYLDIIHDELRTESVNSKFIKQVIKITSNMDKEYKSLPIYKSAILFFFFYIARKRPELYNTDFLRNLYEAANKYYDVEDLSDVPTAILFITVIKKKDFSYFKNQLLYWNNNKDNYKPKLKLRITSDSMPYDEWVLKLSDGRNTDIEDTQMTRASMNVINTSIAGWEGFETCSDNNEKTRDLVELLLDSKQRRLYYFSKILDEIIKVQNVYTLKNIEDVFEPICEGHLIVDRLLTILNSSFDGMSLGDTDGWALGSIKARQYAHDFIEDDDYPGDERGKRKYICAYMIGKYQNDREKSKEIIISKELLLMMLLVLKMYSPDNLSMDDVNRILFNSRFGDELSYALFDEFFVDAFNRLRESGVNSSLIERLRILKDISAYYEEIGLLDNKAIFAEAIIGKESRDGK